MRREVLLLAEIVDAPERIVELTHDASTEMIELDRTRREALLWSFTVRGEACGQLADTFTANHPDVAWRAPSDLRNRIVHGYWQVSTQILLATAQDDIPGFLASVRIAQRSIEESP